MNSQHQLSRCHIIANNIIAGLAYERLISNDPAKSSAYIAIGLVSTETSSTYSQVPFIARCKWQLIKKEMIVLSRRSTEAIAKWNKAIETHNIYVEYRTMAIAHTHFFHIHCVFALTIPTIHLLPVTTAVSWRFLLMLLIVRAHRDVEIREQRLRNRTS